MTYSFWGESYSSIFALAPLDMDGRLVDEAVLSSYGLTVSIAYGYSPSGGSIIVVDDSGGGEAGEGDSGGAGNVPEPGTLSMTLALACLSLAKWGRHWLFRLHRYSAVVDGQPTRR